jgi:hypothetical protein
MKEKDINKALVYQKIGFDHGYTGEKQLHNSNQYS